MEENIQDDDPTLPPGRLEVFVIVTVQYEVPVPQRTVQSGVRLKLVVPDTEVGEALYRRAIDFWNYDRVAQGLDPIPDDHLTLYWCAEPVRYSSARAAQGGVS